MEQLFGIVNPRPQGEASFSFRHDGGVGQHAAVGAHGLRSLVLNAAPVLG